MKNPAITCKHYATSVRISVRGTTADGNPITFEDRFMDIHNAARWAANVLTAYFNLRYADALERVEREVYG